MPNANSNYDSYNNNHTDTTISHCINLAGAIKDLNIVLSI